MKRFEFRYEPLLRKRKHLEDLLKQQVAEVFSRMAPKQARLEQLDRQWHAVQRNLLDPTGLPPAQLALHDHQLRSIADEQQLLNTELRKLEQELALVRQKLTLAHQDFKIMERFKERKLETHLAAAAAEETREFDEIAVVRKARSRSEEEAQ
ncbi:MAG: hypothetical protein A2284_13520 [Deltaproteobacteria bacterium RIFOXYA12_FULL_61_11]|nr:MAG: hypothetical protein A2284_13520 [Deltaproteobacteria bacterium RIFOXYA12_FULL_61_11]